MTEYVTLNGNTYSDGTSDEGSGIRYLDNDGHQTWLLPMFQDFMVEQQAAQLAAQDLQAAGALLAQGMLFMQQALAAKNQAVAAAAAAAASAVDAANAAASINQDAIIEQAFLFSQLT